jgi:hypothetical protein
MVCSIKASSLRAGVMSTKRRSQVAPSPLVQVDVLDSFIYSKPMIMALILLIPFCEQFTTADGLVGVRHSATDQMARDNHRRIRSPSTPQTGQFSPGIPGRPLHMPIFEGSLHHIRNTLSRRILYHPQLQFACSPSGVGRRHLVWISCSVETLILLSFK